MNPLLFLGAALVLSVLGTVILWARSRYAGGRESSVDEFRSKMQALSDEPRATGSRNGTGRRGG